MTESRSADYLAGWAEAKQAAAEVGDDFDNLDPMAFHWKYSEEGVGAAIRRLEPSSVPGGAKK